MHKYFSQTCTASGVIQVSSMQSLSTWTLHPTHYICMYAFVYTHTYSYLCILVTPLFCALLGKWTFRHPRPLLGAR